MIKIGHFFGFIKARLSERSTQTAIVVGITGAATLPYPWGIIVAVLSTVFAMVPDNAKPQ